MSVIAFLGSVAAYDQIHSKFASASTVRQNEKNLGALIALIKTLVEENRRADLRRRLEIANKRLYSLEEKYSSNSQGIPSQARDFHESLRGDKRYLEEQLRK